MSRERDNESGSAQPVQGRPAGPGNQNERMPRPVDSDRAREDDDLEIERKPGRPTTVPEIERDPAKRLPHYTDVPKPELEGS